MTFDRYLVIYRDDDEASIGLRTRSEVEELLTNLAPYNIEWMTDPSKIDNMWFYDRIEDWPEKTGVIIKLLPVTVTPVKVVTKYKLE